MRKALMFIVLAVIALAPPAMAESEEETIRLLVPAGTSMSGRALQAEPDGGTGWTRVVVPLGDSVESTVDDLERDLGVEVIVERRYPLLGPSDEPHFPSQWALENTGQQGGKPDADIDARTAWKMSTGQGVVVAVVDSGVNVDHPEFDGQMWQNPGEVINGADDDGNGYVDDVGGWDFEDDDNDATPSGASGDDAHGTFVAGIVAARVDGTGMTGVAPGAKVMNLRACDDGGCFSLDAARAIRYAVDNGARIVNLSFGGASPQSVGDPPISSAIDYARQNDVLVVSAAGNTPPGQMAPGMIIVPAELPQSNNVAVAATTRKDNLASFSFYGPRIDIAAPGVDILSTGLTGYGTGSGTSFSAPVVSGVAALLWAHDPGISHLELVARLMAWTDRPTGVAGKVQSGRVNAGKLLTNRFVDTVGHTFEADAAWAASEGVTQGCNPPENTRFCPNQSVTREQMAAFLSRYLKLPAAGKDHFVDDGSSTFQSDINRLAQAGITKGCNPPANDRFCPRDTVTRDQMAAFLVRAFGLAAHTHPGFVDVASTSTFALDIDRLATAGITRGCNPPANTRYCPGDDVSRGQMAAFIHRADG